MTWHKKTLEAWHNKERRKGRHGFRFENCWTCQRQLAICKSKIRYGTREEVDDAVEEINVREEYTQPVVRYLCRSCGLWHVATARGKQSIRRAERRRRKWLIQRLAQVAQEKDEFLREVRELG